MEQLLPTVVEGGREGGRSWTERGYGGTEGEGES